MLIDPAHDWELEQDDFGGPLVFHRHAAASVPAYVIGGTPERRLAQCSECLQYLAFAESELAGSVAE